MSRYRFDGGPLRAAREAQGISRERVAVEIDRSVSLITLIELGVRTPAAETLAALCRVVGVSIDTCFVEVDEVPA